MAKLLKELPRHRVSSRYPWKKWADGRSWKLEPNVDFHCSPQSFRSAAYAHAVSIGAKVKTRASEDGSVAIQFVFGKPRKATP